MRELADRERVEQAPPLRVPEPLAGEAFPGRPPKLSGKQTRRLREILLEGALLYVYATDLWTVKRVAEVIEKEYGEE